MKIIALMVVRNEEWVIEASVDAALKWCDGIAFYFDRCDDKTVELATAVVKASGKEATARYGGYREHWNEMQIRHENYIDGKNMGGTHFAIIDADEILTGNLHDQVRKYFACLAPGQVVAGHMIMPVDGLDEYRIDNCEWTRSYITLGFCDAPGLGWAPRGDEAYQHHARPPRGHNPENILRIPPNPEDGGIFHLQWVNRSRLVEKHAWYMATEMARWPQYGAEVINNRYTYALRREDLRTAPIPSEWWSGVSRAGIHVDMPVPWRRREIEALIAKHGREYFKGLSLLKDYCDSKGGAEAPR